MRRQFNQNVNGRKTVAWCSLFAGEFSLFFGYLCDVLKRARHTFPGSHAIFSSQTKTLYWFWYLIFLRRFLWLAQKVRMEIWTARGLQRACTSSKRWNNIYSIEGCSRSRLFWHSYSVVHENLKSYRLMWVGQYGITKDTHERMNCFPFLV